MHATNFIQSQVPRVGILPSVGNIPTAAPILALPSPDSPLFKLLTSHRPAQKFSFHS